MGIAYRASGVRHIAIIGNHLPRRCGIATFTTDLADAVAAERGGAECSVLAMNEPGHRYDYPARVAFEIGEGDIASYRRAADFLNVNSVDVVSLQHEYGIFGGPAGALLLDLLRELRMPIVTTCHTVLGEPNAAQRSVMGELSRLSERMVVMSTSGAELLRTVHDVDARKIDVIPHGIPIVPSAKDSKDKLGLEGNDVILTFGLLSPDKGIEYVIDALPQIVAQRPNTLYVVLGVTHPHVKEREGERYRLMLESRAKRIGVDSHIIFHDRFVSHAELVEFLSAADIYVTPYLQSEQITSGTLAYAVGAGKAVIATPYRYARELLGDGRGVVVPSRDSPAIACAATDILTDSAMRSGLQERAAAYGRQMTWPVVAAAYLESFDRAAQGSRRRAVFRAKTLARRPVDSPELDLTHVRLLTDDTGILQHAAFGVPRYADGYCLDDNARALLLTTALGDAGVEPTRSVRSLAARYLAFVNHAFDGERGRFRNFMDYSRRWLAGSTSDDDCHGRALWALGGVAGRSSDPSARGLARALFHAALPAMQEMTSPRAWAYALLGIHEYLRAFQGESGVEAMMIRLSGRLHGLLRATSTPEWPWFEDRLTYGNARLAQGLLVAGERAHDDVAVAAALRALSWLCAQQTADGVFAPIGSNGFYLRGGVRAGFDQQPVEASATISACLEAHRITGDAAWSARAQQAFRWFLGWNQLELPLYDPVSGGCRDGLHADRLNENMGAESTLSFLLSHLEMRAAERIVTLPTETSRAAVPSSTAPIAAVLRPPVGQAAG